MEVFLATVKAEGASVLTRYKYHRVPPEKYIVQVPLDRVDLPPGANSDAVVQCVSRQIRLSDILMVASTIPMRQRGKAKKGSVTEADAVHVSEQSGFFQLLYHELATELFLGFDGRLCSESYSRTSGESHHHRQFIRDVKNAAIPTEPRARL